MLTINDLMKMLSVSKTTIYSIMKQSQFPRPFHVGGSARWDALEINEWLEQQKAKRNEAKTISRRGRPPKIQG